MLIAAAMLCTGCVDTRELAEAYNREDTFARRFITDLHAGGLPRVRDRVKPATLNGPWDLAAEFATMRQALPAGPLDSLRALDTSFERDGGLLVTQIGYNVYGGGEMARVELWIETTRDTHYVETLRVSEMDPPAVMK